MAKEETDSRDCLGFVVLPFFVYYDFSFCDEKAHDAASVIFSNCLSVLLGQGQSQGSQELVHGHVDLRGEVDGEHDGHDHLDAVSDEL